MFKGLCKRIEHKDVDLTIRAQDKDECQITVKLESSGSVKCWTSLEQLRNY